MKKAAAEMSRRTRHLQAKPLQSYSITCLDTFLKKQMRRSHPCRKLIRFQVFHRSKKKINSLLMRICSMISRSMLALLLIKLKYTLMTFRSQELSCCHLFRDISLHKAASLRSNTRDISNLRPMMEFSSNLIVNHHSQNSSSKARMCSPCPRKLERKAR